MNTIQVSLLTRFALGLAAISSADGLSSTLKAVGYDRAGRPVVEAYLREDAKGARLWLSYFEAKGGTVRPCVSPRTRVYAVFITGPQHARETISIPMEAVCHPDFRSAFQEPGRATLSLSQDSKVVWEKIFPAQADGSRWYALQLAFTTEYDTSSPVAGWDSDFGANYRLILK